MTRLLDSNILIYSAQPEHAALRHWLSEGAAISTITIAEVLGYPELTDQDAADFELWFSMIELMQVSELVIRRAASLRRRKRIKLGDAIIAATALVHGCELVTRNTADFRWIDGLRLVDPLDS